MKRKLNLAVLNKRQEEMTVKEMNAVRAGRIKCECEVECGGIMETYDTVWNPIDFSSNCPCGSIWTIFGLAWG
jgi:hypothetical protein